MTVSTTCERCTGVGGAHYAFCFLAQAWERFMGPGYPFMPPQPAEQSQLDQLRRGLDELRQAQGTERRINERSYEALAREIGELAEEVTKPAEIERRHEPVATILPPGYLDGLATAQLARHVIEAKRPAEPEPELQPEPETASTEETLTSPSVEAPAPTHAERGLMAAESMRKKAGGPVTRFLADNTEPGTDEDYVDGPTLRGLYETWRVAAGEPALSPRMFGAGISAAGLRRKQAQSNQAINGTKPMLVYGIRLPGTTPRAERTFRKPEPKPGSAEHIRAIAEQARRQARERAEAEPAPVPVAEPEVDKSSNNGWTNPKAPSSSTSELTLKQLQAENAAKTILRASGYTGPRPRTEDPFDQETKDLVNGLLDLDAGFEYTPVIGRSKAFVRTPDGSRFPLATTHGGSIGRVGNNRQLRRWLNRKGYLPTAAAPVSQLTVPEVAKPKPLGGVTVIKADGSSRTLADEVAVVEADPGADPLTPEELDMQTFDLWEDCREGLPGSYPFIYHPNVLSLAGLNTDEVETAIRKPGRIEIRPETKEKGYPVFAFQRGDVRAILGFRDRAKPSVIACYWTTLLANDEYRVNRSGGGGSKTMSGLPTNPGASVKRLRSLGAKIEEAANGKTAVVTYRGQELGQITTGVAIPKATVQSDYQRCLRKMNAIDQREGALV